MIFCAFFFFIKSKTLDNPNINFTIRALSVNPNGKLMAVAGDHEIVVVVLPRSGYTRSRAEMVECRCVYSVYACLACFLAERKGIWFWGWLTKYGW